jgi:hypothetical protein
MPVPCFVKSGVSGECAPIPGGHRTRPVGIAIGPPGDPAEDAAMVTPAMQHRGKRCSATAGRSRRGLAMMVAFWQQQQDL